MGAWPSVPRRRVVTRLSGRLRSCVEQSAAAGGTIMRRRSGPSRARTPEPNPYAPGAEPTALRLTPHHNVGRVPTQPTGAEPYETFLAAAIWRSLRTRRLSRSDIPPQMPNFSPVVIANSRHSTRT